MAGDALRRRSPWTVAAAVVIALLLWWFTADDAPGPQSEDSATVGSSSQGDRPATAGPAAGAEGEVDDHGFETVRLADLPVEAKQVVAQIDAGGPFDHPGKDGSTFSNFEGNLPSAARGHYREYTVATPGLSHRGARRIVTGAEDEMYWTDDHYETFRRILR